MACEEKCYIYVTNKSRGFYTSAYTISNVIINNATDFGILQSSK